MKDVLKKIADKKSANHNGNIDENALYDLIMRVTKRKDYADKFRFLKTNNTAFDSYVMYDEGEKIVVEASSGVAAAVAINFYLREYCNSYIGPINSNINLPQNPPFVGKRIENKTVFLFRYFLNYCTFSYSLLFATWEEYEQLTDWMLLSGVNLYLNIVGHEIVWRDTLLELGYTKEEVSDYICGPAYLPWQWMGNMSHFGGNLPERWYDEQKALSNKINDKMRLFGAEPMLPGYFGIVPRNFADKFPNSIPVNQGSWFDTFDQPSLLLPQDEMFDKIAGIFYKKIKEHFGNINYFSGDPFHEGGNSKGFDFALYCSTVIGKMKCATETGIWFLQGWLETPKREMLSMIDKEDVVVISLSADKNYNECDNFNGYPWIYSATTNFGGTRIMDGNLRGFLCEPFDAVAKEDITTVGIGMTMEGIEDNEILYEGITYNAIREQKPDVDEFLESYAKSRYGICNESIFEALKILSDEIFVLNEENNYSGRESGLCAIPGLDVKTVTYPSHAYKVCYDEERLKKCRDLLLENFEKLKDNECYRFDLMDILRQINANESWHLMDEFVSAFKGGDYEGFVKSSDKFLALYDEQEKIMDSGKTKLQNFVKHAKAYAENESEKIMFAFNAINLIMLWADKDFPPILIDYAYREWSGVLGLYKKRWSIFIELMRVNFYTPEKLKSINWREISFAEEMDMMKI